MAVTEAVQAEVTPATASAVLDPFIPAPEVRERFTVRVHAPAATVMEAARTLDMQSVFLVRSIFRLRELFLGSAPVAQGTSRGILADTLAMGWGVLDEEPGRFIACGARTQPWLANVTFTPIPSNQFAEYREPGQVKIAWTLEVDAIAPELSDFAHETRVVCTDAVARRKFGRYWRWARFGVVAIRWLLLPAVKREAERRWRAARPQVVF